MRRATYNMMPSPTEFHASIADVTNEHQQNMNGMVASGIHSSAEVEEPSDPLVAFRPKVDIQRLFMNREAIHVGAESWLVALSLYGCFGFRASAVYPDYELVPIRALRFGFGVFEHIDDVHPASLAATSAGIKLPVIDGHDAAFRGRRAFTGKARGVLA